MTTTTLPAHLRLDGFPAHLLRNGYKQWVVAGADKIPLNPRSGKRASVTDPESWGSLQAARGRASREGLHLGWVLYTPPYVLEGGPRLVCVDIDNCIDGDGNLAPDAAAIVAELNSYTEVSRSGRGLHILVNAKLPPGRRRFPGGIEMYDRDRYILLTGDVRPDWGDGVVRRRPEALAALHARLSASVAPETPAAAAPVTPLTLEDTEILERARGAKNGTDFAALFDRGQTDAYDNDDSRADQALCSKLAFWTQDPEQIDRLFRQSALYRPKWERADYRQSTISKAMQRSAFYTPPAITSQPAPAVSASHETPAAGDPCAAREAQLLARIADLERENVLLRTLILNEHLSHTDKMGIVAANTVAAEKVITGRVEPDGRPVLSTLEISGDERPAPGPDERLSPVNPRTGRKPRMTRSSAKPFMERAIANGWLNAEVRPRTRTRANGTPYPDVEFAVTLPASNADALAPAAHWRPEQPKIRKLREVRACPHCDEVHPVTAICDGCGTVRDDVTVILPKDDAPAPMSEKNSDIATVAPLRYVGKDFGHSGDPVPFAKERREQRRSEPTPRCRGL